MRQAGSYPKEFNAIALAHRCFPVGSVVDDNQLTTSSSPCRLRDMHSSSPNPVFSAHIAEIAANNCRQLNRRLGMNLESYCKAAGATGAIHSAA